MSPKPSAKPATAIPSEDRCKYVAASGRRCRANVARDTSRTSGYSAFCLPHSQMEQQFLDSKSVAKDLIGPIDDFRTCHAINEVLGKLLILVAENRIPLRNANALSYICQLLLTSMPGIRRELQLTNRGEELFVLNRTTDLMWGKAEDNEAEKDKKTEDNKPPEGKPAVRKDAEHESLKPVNALAAATRILQGR